MINKFFADIILASSFAGTFLCVFFFLYTKNVEKTITINNVDMITNSLFNSLSFLSQEAKLALKYKLKSINIDMKHEDEETAKNNASLLKKAALWMTPYFILCLVLSFFILHQNAYEYKHSILENLYLLLGIAIVEFCFLNYIAKNCISSDPNYVKSTIIDMLKT